MSDLEMPMKKPMSRYGSLATMPCWVSLLGGLASLLPNGVFGDTVDPADLGIGKRPINFGPWVFAGSWRHQIAKSFEGSTTIGGQPRICGVVKMRRNPALVNRATVTVSSYHFGVLGCLLYRSEIPYDMILLPFHGSGVAIAEAFYSVVIGGGELTGLGSRVEILGGENVALPAAERPTAFIIANEHGNRFVSRTPALLPVLTGGGGFSFGLGGTHEGGGGGDVVFHNDARINPTLGFASSFFIFFFRRECGPPNAESIRAANNL